MIRKSINNLAGGSNKSQRVGYFFCEYSHADFVGGLATPLWCYFLKFCSYVQRHLQCIFPRWNPCELRMRTLSSSHAILAPIKRVVLKLVNNGCGQFRIKSAGNVLSYVLLPLRSNVDSHANLENFRYNCSHEVAVKKKNKFSIEFGDLFLNSVHTYLTIANTFLITWINASVMKWT